MILNTECQDFPTKKVSFARIESILPTRMLSRFMIVLPVACDHDSRCRRRKSKESDKAFSTCWRMLSFERSLRVVHPCTISSKRIDWPPFSSRLRTHGCPGLTVSESLPAGRSRNGMFTLLNISPSFRPKTRCSMECPKKTF